MSSQQIYLSSNCSYAFQLNWSVSVFGNEGLPSPEGVIEKLRNSIVRDDLKILEYRKAASNVVQFFVSSQPKHSPAEIVRCIVAMKLLNHLASTQNMRPVFKHSYYVGTFGEFDRGAIWNSLSRGIVSERRCEVYQCM